MSIFADLDAAGVLETVLNGKQPVAPILASLQSAIADAKLALTRFERALAGVQAIVAEIEAARKT